MYLRAFGFNWEKNKEEEFLISLYIEPSLKL